MIQDSIELIKQAIADMPEVPGVYRMYGKGEQLLYVGKAKNLPARVISYSRTEQLSYRIKRMVAQIERIEYEVTASETEALLLEANQIKKLKPKYNILLRDDKSFPYIKITKHDFPRVEKFRGKLKKGEEYFGPFANIYAVNDAVMLLQKAFLLRPCSDSYMSNRTSPCLQYQIKRCSAPCVAKISKEGYQELLQQARDFLKGKTTNIQQILAEEMNQAAQELQYEKAASLRDRIAALGKVQQQQRESDFILDDADVIALYISGGGNMDDSGDDKQQEKRSGAGNKAYAAVNIAFFRRGYYFGNHSYFPKISADDDYESVMQAFIVQFYQKHSPPDLLITSHIPAESEQVEDYLDNILHGSDNRQEKQYNRKVQIVTPKRGGKLRAVNKALERAKSALERHIAGGQSWDANMSDIAELFAIGDSDEDGGNKIRRIEIYDNSHIMGRNAVGAMVVAGEQGFEKSEYRKYNFDMKVVAGSSNTADHKGGNDYAMMCDMIGRRFERMYKQQEETPDKIPDIMLIDGGVGHLGAVMAVVEQYRDKIANMPLIVAIAKGRDRNAGREWFHIDGKAPFQLPKNDSRLFFLQTLRDEAHNFAIGSHRKKRKSNMGRSELDNIPAIGKSRRKVLLTHFGSASAVAEATVDELKSLPGISASIAQSIYEYFNG